MPSRHETSPTTKIPARIERRSQSTTAALPLQIQDAVPSCAQSCISTFIHEEFYCSQDDFNCYCSYYGSAGYTLGELAIMCLRLDCPSADASESVAAYNICSAQTSAVAPTHSTLTLPSAPTSMTAISSSLDTSPTLSTSPTRASTTTSSQSISTAVTITPAPAGSVSTLSVMLGSKTAPASTSSATSSATPSYLHSGSTSLTSAQAIGISIAAVGAVMIAIATVYLCVCLRRRKLTKEKKDHDSYDFIDDAPRRFSPLNHGQADPKGPFRGIPHPRAELASEKEKEKQKPTWPSRYFDADDFQRYHCETSRNPGSRRAFSPSPSHRAQHAYASAQPDATSLSQSRLKEDSIRTTSQLLPDMPTTVQPPRPKSQPKPPQPAIMSTPATVFEENQGTPMLQPSSHLPMPPVAHHPPDCLRIGNKIDPPKFGTQMTRSPEQMRPPSLSLQIPRQAPRSDRILSVDPVPIPPALREEEQRSSTVQSTTGSRSPSSFLNYYAETSSPELYSSTPIEEESQTRRPAPAAITVTKPSYPPRAVRMSFASDTSFESSCSDEVTPPEEDDRRLTPVVESPIATVRYPKVPRSSNQAVPRSPASGSPRRLEMPSDVRSHRELLPSNQCKDNTPQDRPQNPITPPPRQNTQTPSLSGTTLAGRNRVDNNNHHKARLHINTSPNNTIKYAIRPAFKPLRLEYPPPRKDSRHESPLKGYGRVTSNGARQQSGDAIKSPGASMKSPLWEPKLTPRREGGDLYLSVSAATPMAGHFPSVR